MKSKFWGRSIQLDPVGVLTLEFDDGEVLQWSKVCTPETQGLCSLFSKFMSKSELFLARLRHPFTTSFWESCTVITMVRCEYKESMSFHVS